MEPHQTCAQGAWNSPSSPSWPTPRLGHQEEVPEAGTYHPRSNVLLKGSFGTTKESLGSQAESQGRVAERPQSLSLRGRELNKPWRHPGPRWSPGAARSWTCSSCAARHLAWESAHIWGDQLASEGAPTPTASQPTNQLTNQPTDQPTDPSKPENTTEPIPGGQYSWSSVTCLATVAVMWSGRRLLLSRGSKVSRSNKPMGHTAKAHLVTVEEC